MKFTPAKRQQFIETLADTGNVTLAAEAIGMSRRQAYNVRETDQEFCAEWDDAIERSMDNLEHALRKRALDGVDEPVVSMGKLVKDDEGKPLVMKRYSDSVGIALLKGRRPAVFRDRVDMKHAGDLNLKAEDAREFLIAELDKIAERLGNKD